LIHLALSGRKLLEPIQADQGLLRGFFLLPGFAAGQKKKK
jgi:hypothetical protein